jgi:hypothetical protein
MVRLLATLAALLLGCAAAADGLPPEEWTLRAIPDPHPEPLLAREMLTITLRGDYGDYIALERLEVPPIGGLGWLQLGFDLWSEEMVDGLPRRIFERRIAVWPEEDGAVTLPPLTHRMTLAPRGSTRHPFEVTSEPLTLQVGAPPPHEGWWLPARGVSAVEEWSGGDAEALRPGQPLTRTVRLTVLGVTPDRVGPQPSLKSDTVFAFPEAEERSVTLTPDGPVSVVTWRWSILPDTPRPTVVEPVVIHWFDTVARQMRTLTLPPKRIAVAADVFGVERRGDALQRLAPFAAPTAAALAFCAGLVAALRGWRPAGALRSAAAPFRRARLRLRLRRAVEIGDAFAARRLARAMARDADDPRLEPLDRLAYGRDAATASASALRAAVASWLRREPAK